ncbi:hypothetical protein AYO41_02965 [Verrucomicrobia bacterium SCGC AG-212-E04]|nr:hypothetical protein AYO41_02965 [Verrucomicrobia bacterium SCGC AG-212-E04]
MLFAALVLVLSVSAATAVRADDLMWGGLLIAENPVKDAPTHPPTKLPAPLLGREKQIAGIFGYKGLRVIGQAKQKIKTGEEDWLVPSKRFYVKVDTKNPIPNGYLVGLQLYQDDKMLVEATVKLARGNPLYIRGPQVGSGQLIIALVTDKETSWQKAKAVTAKPAASPVGAPSPGLSPSPASAPPPATVPGSVPDAPKPTGTPTSVSTI